jgi:hypothetical protein
MRGPPSIRRHYWMLGLGALGLAALVAAGACSSDVASTGPQKLGTCTTLPGSSSIGCVVDGGSSMTDCLEEGCDVYHLTPLALSSAWLIEQRSMGVCSTSPPVVAMDVCATHGELFASCEPRSVSPTACALSTGVQFCSAGRWTALCAHNSDCPEGSLCLNSVGTGDVPAGEIPPFGECIPACSHPGSVDCGRCDWECSMATGVCAQPAGQPDGGQFFSDAGVDAAP